MSMYTAHLPRQPYITTQLPHPQSHSAMGLSHTTLADDSVHDIHLYASNYLPTNAEAQFLKRTLEEQDKAIQTLDSQILSMENLLTEFRARRVALVESSTIKKALLAPVRKLAPEILGEVFGWCLPNAGDPNAYCPITPASAPLLLTQVCGRWRSVALGTPQLWTNLALEETAGFNLPAVIPMCLRASGTLHINILLGAGIEKLYYSNLRGDAFKAGLRLIGAHFDRCTSFRATDSPILSTIFPPEHSTSAPSLHELQIVHGPSSFQSPTAPLNLGQIVAPNLESLDICRPSTLVKSIAMDHSRLRNLRWGVSTSDHSMEALLQIMDSCSHLEECDAWLPKYAEDISLGAERISLPNLRRLSLKFPLAADPSHLMSIIEAPSLEYLAFEQLAPISRGPDLGRALRSLLKVASPPLREVHVTNVVLTQDDIFLLHPLSNVESLQFHRCFLHAPFVAAFYPQLADQSNSSILPMLSSLHFNATGIADAGSFVRMVESRVAVDSSHRTRLSSVSLSQCPLPREEKEALGKLAEIHEGFRAEFA